MKVLILILSLFLLSSCSQENLWQKVGLAEPDPIVLETQTCKAEISEGQVDVVKSFTGDRDSMISFSISKPESFEGGVLYAQSRSKAEAMAQMLNAKCYDKEKIKAFLESPIDDEELIRAMKNTVYLLDEGKSSIVNMIIGFLPTFEKNEDTGEFIDSLIDYYNSVKAKIKNGADTILSDVFQPLFTLLSSSETPTWGEYVRCQLSINLISGVFEGMERTVEGVLNAVFNEELIDEIFNLENQEDNDRLMNVLMDVGVKALLDIASGVVSSVLSPVAVYNSVAYSYGDVIGMKSLLDLIETKGE